MVTLSEIHREGTKMFIKAGLKSPAFDSLCLMGKVFGIENRVQLAIRGNETADDSKAALFLSLCRERLNRPLQYILGAWEFDGMSLSCGEGVLVPREDTMTLVEAAQTALKGTERANILDLCAGTGAVGIALARRLPGSKCTCVELSEKAMPYLKENIARFAPDSVTAVKADVLCEPAFGKNSFDAIVSNPPYIRTDVIPTLDTDVRKEPEMALDGGADGLVFYRAILEKWLCLLMSGGTLAVEIGYDQAEEVTKLFKDAGLYNVRCIRDMSGSNRTIIGTYLYDNQK